MKTILNSSVCCLYLAILLVFGCSKDEVSEVDDQYMSANIDGVDFMVDHNVGEFTSSRILATHGTVNLQVKGRLKNGDAIWFLIQNYHGAKMYNFSNNFISPGKIGYISLSSGGNWDSSLSGNQLEAPAQVEIVTDDGAVIEGHFNFDGYNLQDFTKKVVRNGNFRIRIP